MQVVVIDYGMGNLQSVLRAFEECGADVIISDQPASLKTASHIVLPGVGAFSDAMNQIHAMGWHDAIRHEAIQSHVPLLGICLGMQLLADTGCEGGQTQGLGLVPGTVQKLVPDTPQTHIPHVGWNEFHRVQDHPLFEGIADGTDFYFVHSYHFKPASGQHAIGSTPYCGGFVSAVQSDNIFGVQFHPEKSHRPGFRIIENFLNIN